LNVEKAFITLATDVKDRMIVDGNAGATTGGQKVTAKNTAPSRDKKGCC
jgi:hypothetical protein